MRILSEIEPSVRFCSTRLSRIGGFTGYRRIVGLVVLVLLAFGVLINSVIVLADYSYLGNKDGADDGQAEGAIGIISYFAVNVTVGSADITTVQVSAKILDFGEGDNFKAVIWDADSGNLVSVSTEEYTGLGSMESIWFTLPITATLSANTEYYIGIVGEDNAFIRLTVGGPINGVDGWKDTSECTYSPPGDFVMTGFNGGCYLIYVDYTLPPTVSGELMTSATLMTQMMPIVMLVVFLGSLKAGASFKQAFEYMMVIVAVAFIIWLFGSWGL